MSRQSTVIAHSDSGGEYEVEIFATPHPKCVIICSHGNGVRRWDGERFFYAVANHCKESAVMLVDQNQPVGDGVSLNPLPVLVRRVQETIAEAKWRYQGVPIVVLGHSMGCAVASQLDLSGVAAVVFEAPGAGSPLEGLAGLYGQDVLGGKSVTTSDGLLKVITKEYIDSVKGRNWDESYAALLKRFHPVYAFEAGNEEIVGEERLAHRSLPFDKYEILPGAKHNLVGGPLTDFLGRFDGILSAVTKTT